MSRLVVFDCDGTLVDGQAAICETMELAFTSNGLAAPDRHHVRRMVGLSLPYALRELALRHVARFATSRGKLLAYLNREIGTGAQ